MKIRNELPADFDAVERLNDLAFQGDGESKLVARLRKTARPLISLVAEQDQTVIGHILFSPVTLSSVSNSSLKLMGLAPMAVAPQNQKQGVGSALIEAGLDCCREAGTEAVVVLGHPNYYPKFGFESASRFNIKSEYEVPEEAFMLLELAEGVMKAHAGTIRYHAEFSAL